LHSVDRQLQIEVPHGILSEVARRTSEDATRTEIRDALHDHVRKEHEFRGPDGSSAVDMILQSKTDAPVPVIRVVHPPTGRRLLIQRGVHLM
jgi:hypothetical protein